MSGPQVVVERTKNRSSRALVRDGIIVIRLARRLSETEEQHHIQWLLQKMAPIYEREQKRVSIDPFRTLLHGAEHLELITNLGHTWNFVLTPSSRATVKVSGNTVALGVPATLNGKRLHRHLWKVLTRLCAQEMEEFVYRCNRRTFDEHIAGVKVRPMSSQWGSCSSKGVITLNPALLCVPLELFEYVVIHELAHIQHKNHSVRFWSAVAEYCDNFTERKKNLNQKRIIKL